MDNPEDFHNPTSIRYSGNFFAGARRFTIEDGVFMNASEGVREDHVNDHSERSNYSNASHSDYSQSTSTSTHIHGRYGKFFCTTFRSRSEYNETSAGAQYYESRSAREREHPNSNNFQPPAPPGAIPGHGNQRRIILQHSAGSYGPDRRSNNNGWGDREDYCEGHTRSLESSHYPNGGGAHSGSPRHPVPVRAPTHHQSAEPGATQYPSHNSQLHYPNGGGAHSVSPRRPVPIRAPAHHQSTEPGATQHPSHDSQSHDPNGSGAYSGSPRGSVPARAFPAHHQSTEPGATRYPSHDSQSHYPNGRGAYSGSPRGSVPARAFPAHHQSTEPGATPYLSHDSQSHYPNGGGAHSGSPRGSVPARAFPAHHQSTESGATQYPSHDSQYYGASSSRSATGHWPNSRQDGRYRSRGNSQRPLDSTYGLQSEADHDLDCRPGEESYIAEECSVGQDVRYTQYQSDEAGPMDRPPPPPKFKSNNPWASYQ
ncbi:hypothetical protein D9757_008703 [Collybiopsis confluens]|uniref:Uncharacterized protein n=1 Tax=Collybiopsis confluens TaxID=2823264 RepID=A0A8H5H927_9AGAR|nr:hypothetical protein D9757_008703 [Collybiopsis confluens]